jgi:hypothetical protein
MMQRRSRMNAKLLSARFPENKKEERNESKAFDPA